MVPTPPSPQRYRTQKNNLKKLSESFQVSAASAKNIYVLTQALIGSASN